MHITLLNDKITLSFHQNLIINLTQLSINLFLSINCKSHSNFFHLLNN